MMRSTIILLSIMFGWIINLQAQSNPSQKAWFPLPLTLDEKEVLANFYLSANYADYKKKDINAFTNSKDNGESLLVALYKSIQNGSLAEYVSLTDKKDPDEKEGWRFYTTFLKKAKQVKIAYRFDAGNLRAYYLETEPGLPLMAVGISFVNGKWIHTPSKVNVPLLQTVSEAINWINGNKADDRILSTKPNTNSEVVFDSLFSNEVTNSISFHFNAYKISFDADKKVGGTDTLKNIFDEKVAETLKFYESKYQKLKQNDTSAWFKSFTPESRNRSYETISGISKKDFDYYKRFKLSFSKIGYVIDLGNVDLVFFRNSSTLSSQDGAIVKSYIYKNNPYYMANEHVEFYLDDLLKEKEFKMVLNQ